MIAVTQKEVSEIVSATGMTREGWRTPVSPDRLVKLLDIETLPRIICGIHSIGDERKPKAELSKMLKVLKEAESSA